MKFDSILTPCDMTLTNPQAAAVRPEFQGVYAGDLLSRAMSRVKADDLFITIIANRNTVAVASLTDAAAVLLAEGVTLPDDAKAAADENGIPIYSSPKTVFELCKIIGGLGENP